MRNLGARPVRDRLAEAIELSVPAELQHLAGAHWTPVEVALRAAVLLETDDDTRVLDVGSGIGTASIAGALTRPGVWCGIEQHRSLVDIATQVATRCGVTSRTHFVVGDALSLDWGAYDALYLYNPFELELGTSERTLARRDSLLAEVERRLARLRPNTHVLTLHGFGGEMPASLEPCQRERVLGYELTLWRQRGA